MSSLFGLIQGSMAVGLILSLHSDDAAADDDSDGQTNGHVKLSTMIWS